MKKNVLAVFLFLLFLSGCIIYVPYEGEEETRPRAPREEETYQREYADYSPEMDYEDFYEYLSPHGIWVRYAPYGFVWIPKHVGRGWRPYTHGRWAWTNYGWTWISYHEWGWVPFHYGRWGWDARLGWYWVPGSIWAPAWVSWRWGSIYIGWCPLPPDIDFVAGIGIGALPDDFPDIYWVFIEGRFFQYDYLDRYVLPDERNRTLVRLTVHKANLTVRNRQLLNEGISPEQVSYITRSRVSRYEIEDGERPGQSRIGGDAVKIFRPIVKKNEAAQPKTYLEKEEALKKVPELRLDDFEKSASPGELERRLKEDQLREIRLLKQSQEKDEVELRRKIDDEEELAETVEEREKIRKASEVRAAELKKEHAEEKEKILKRHKEEEKVIKERIQKKDKKD